MSRSLFVIAAPLVASLTACVLSPTDGDVVTTRNQPLQLDGYAEHARANLEIRAWNHDSGAWEPVRDLRGTTSVLRGEHDMFSWSVRGIELGERYWRPSSLACGAPGTARLAVWERDLVDHSWYQFSTFDEAGQDCLSDEIGAGESPLTAGVNCRTGNEVRLTVGGECPTRLVVDDSPPRVTLRVVGGGDPGDANVYQVSDATVEPELGVYRRASVVPLRADGFDAQGVIATRLDLDVEARCRNGTIVRRTLAATGAASSGRPEVSVGAAIDLDTSRFLALCPGSEGRVGFVARASTTNGNGAIRSTMPLQYGEHL